MTLDEQTKNLLYNACCINNCKAYQENFLHSEINTPLDDQGNTALHLATLYGHLDIIRLLLRYHASRTVVNKDGKKPQEMNSDRSITQQYTTAVRPLPKTDDNHFVATIPEVEMIEWNDSYQNAYRIAFENHQHMKRWITKVPLKKLLQAIDQDYLDTLTFPSNDNLLTLKEQLKNAIDKNDLTYLIKMYTSPTSFYKFLNADMAKLGSDFRFVTTRLDYPDNEPPKNLGQYIFASLIINHKTFQQYQCAEVMDTSYRGMNVTIQDLEAYKKDSIIITRSFLSTSRDRSLVQLFLQFDKINRPPVVCIYQITNLRSSLFIGSLSMIPGEDEILIAPFTVFRIESITDNVIKHEQIEHKIKEIKLVECGSLNAT